jgi:tetratricopeptide (TPR) repeat protein
MHFAEGKFEEARSAFATAASTAEKIYDAENWHFAYVLYFFGDAMGACGDHDEALAIQERSLSIMDRVLGRENPMLTLPRQGVGRELIALLRSTEAEEHLRAALEVAERQLGPENVQLARSLDLLGRALSDQGRYAIALPLHERARALNEKHVRPDHSDLLQSLTGLGRAHLGMHQPAFALPLLERAVALDARGQALEQAEAELLLAHALRDSRHDRQRARKLALDARTIYRGSGNGPRHDRDLAGIETFLGSSP